MWWIFSCDSCGVCDGDGTSCAYVDLSLQVSYDSDANDGVDVYMYNDTSVSGFQFGVNGLFYREYWR